MYNYLQKNYSQKGSMKELLQQNKIQQSYYKTLEKH